MKKISDLESKELSKERDSIEASGESIGMDTYEAGGTIAADVDIYGVCKNCRYFQYIRYEFQGQMAACSRHEKKLSGNQRIVECSDFDQKGKLSLNMMIDIAYDLSYLTEPNTRKAGLI